MIVSKNTPDPSQQKNFYESILNIQSEMICRFLPDTTLTFVNKGYCDYLQLPKSQLLGKKFLELVPDYHHQMVLDHLDHIARTGEIITYEHQVLMDNDSTRWQQWTDYPIFDENDQLIGFQGVGRDVTKSKEYEQKLLEISKSKDHILATVAHDLRDPISGIIGLCQMMEKTNPGGENSLYLNLIQESCNASLHTIGELLEMAQMENEGYAFSKSVENIGEIILDVLSGNEHIALEKKIELRPVLPVKNVFGNVNRPKLQRVLINIISNALKFTNAGGIITVSLKRSKDKITIRIKDTGIGIPEELTHTIFEKFTKGKRSGLNGEKTHGLGLFICKQIIELHQGSISLKSKEGQGTIVSIELPIIKT